MHLTHLTRGYLSALARVVPSFPLELWGVNSRSRTPTRGRITVAGSVDARSHTIRRHVSPSQAKGCSLATSMCNNPYRHGWLPLLGLHNRALIDNLYGACRLFDYLPPAGRLGSPARRDSSPPFALSFPPVVIPFFGQVLSACPHVLAISPFDD